MRLVVLFALLIGLATCADTRADILPETVGIHAVSWHEKDGMNNVNPGIYGRWDNGFTAGTYYNSERRQTFYAGWTFADSSDTFAVTVGAATGYMRASVVPILVPSVRLPMTDRFSLRVSVAPVKDAAAIHLSFEGRF